MFGQKLGWLNLRDRAAGCVVLTLAVAIPIGCKERAASNAGVTIATESPIPAVTRLPAELAQQVLAKVGDRTITLADYALVLDRMDRFERMRYQTAERRRALLDEIINSELLAKEAERRGLDKDPATIAYIDQLFRDEVRRRLRAQVPEAESLPAEEVRAYYAQHLAEFRTPELRRIAAIALPTQEAATKLLAELTTTPSAGQWNDAAIRHAVDGREPGLPVEIVGDLGLISAPPVGQALDRTTNDDPSVGSRVPVAIRAAAFAMQTAGQLFPRPISADGRVYLLRLVAINPARTLSPEEADDEIRARLVTQKLDATYAALEHRLASQEPSATGPSSEVQ